MRNQTQCSFQVNQNIHVNWENKKETKKSKNQESIRKIDDFF